MSEQDETREEDRRHPSNDDILKILKSLKLENGLMKDDIADINKKLDPILEERRDLVGAVRLGGTATRVVATIGGAIITLYGAYLVLRAVFVGGSAPQ